MKTFEQAQRLIIKNTNILKIENILVKESVGRTLQEDIYSKIEMPPFNKSAMDGYAIKAQDLKTVPVKLRNIGVIKAGDSFSKTLRRGECVKIMTGGAVPKGADTVVMVEDTKANAKHVEVQKTLNRGANICLKAEDIRKGARVANKGSVLETNAIALLATVGKKYVKANKKPKVAVLNTGGEIVPTGRMIGKTRIYNSNGPREQFNKSNNKKFLKCKC